MEMSIKQGKGLKISTHRLESLSTQFNDKQHHQRALLSVAFLPLSCQEFYQQSILQLCAQ